MTTPTPIVIQEQLLPWQPIETAPRGGGNPKLLVTNNLKARNAHGHMSHVWLVSMIHDEPGEVTAFKDDGYNKVHGITHWMPLPEARGSISDVDDGR